MRLQIGYLEKFWLAYCFKTKHKEQHDYFSFKRSRSRTQAARTTPTPSLPPFLNQHRPF